MFFRRILLLFVSLLASPAYATLQVSVGIEPIRYLVDQIGGTRVEVTTLLTNGDAHSLSPTPTQLLALKQADIYFGVNLPFEQNLSKRMSEKNKLLWLVDSGETIGQGQEHKHDHSQGLDPHRWTSPEEMLRMSKKVRSKLIELDPDGRLEFVARSEKFEQRVQSLQIQISNLLRTSPSTFVADHPAWGWFCHEFDLRQLSVEHEGKLPSIRQMSDLKSTVLASDARVVVSQHGGGQAQAIADRLGLNLLVIDPLSYAWEQNLLDLTSGLSTQ